MFFYTNGLNTALAIIQQKTKNLENGKPGDIIISENVSRDVHRTGLEPVTTRFEAGYSIHWAIGAIDEKVEYLVAEKKTTFWHADFKVR